MNEWATRHPTLSMSPENPRYWEKPILINRRHGYEGKKLPKHVASLSFSIYKLETTLSVFEELARDEANKWLFYLIQQVNKNVLLVAITWRVKFV